MKTELMQRALRGSEAGELRFPEVIGILHEADVESYQVDFLRGDDTFYLPDGRTHTEAIHVGKVAAEFSRDGVVEAIRAAQADRIRSSGVCAADCKGGGCGLPGEPHWRARGVCGAQG